MKTILIGVLVSASLHAMQEVPEFDGHDPTQNFALPDGSHIQFTPEDFSGDESPRFVTLCPPGAVQPSLAGPPPLRRRRNGARDEVAVDRDRLPLELVSGSSNSIKGIDVHEQLIALCRQGGVGTLLIANGDAEGFMDVPITHQEELIACYFVDEQTIRYIGEQHMYEWNLPSNTIQRVAEIDTYPAICDGFIAVKKDTPSRDGAGAAAPVVAVAPATPPRQPMGCWKMFLWLVFGRKPFGGRKAVYG